MKIQMSFMVLMAAGLAGCGGTSTPTAEEKMQVLEKKLADAEAKLAEMAKQNEMPMSQARALQTIAEMKARELAQANVAGHRVNLGLETFHTTQITDKDLLEVRAQLHNATMSNIATLKMLKDMEDAETKARIGSGLEKAPMTEEEKQARLQELKRKNVEVITLEKDGMTALIVPKDATKVRKVKNPDAWILEYED